MSLASGVHPSDLCSPRACRPLPLLHLNLGIRTGGLWVCLSLNEEPKGPMISVFLTSAPVPSRTQLVANCSLMGVSQQCRGTHPLSHSRPTTLPPLEKTALFIQGRYRDSSATALKPDHSLMPGPPCPRPPRHLRGTALSSSFLPTE